jgi:molecular chaperone DnaJ
VARDYYGILGVTSDAGPDEIKRAYRDSRASCTRTSTRTSGRRSGFAEVSAAYEVLSDPEKRRIVDLGGDPLGNGGQGGGGDPFSAFGFGDIMDAFFGARRGRRAAPAAAQPRAAGADALIRMTLTLEECATASPRAARRDGGAVLGVLGPGTAPAAARRAATSATAAARCRACSGRSWARSSPSRVCPTCRGFGEVIPEPCRRCQGEGRVRSRRDVPSTSRPAWPTACACGWRAAARSGPGGGPAGDLYVEVEEEPHELFTRDGADLHCTVQLR